MGEGINGGGSAVILVQCIWVLNINDDIFLSILKSLRADKNNCCRNEEKRHVLGNEAFISVIPFTMQSK
jgi:hypothetical protein